MIDRLMAQIAGTDCADTDYRVAYYYYCIYIYIYLPLPFSILITRFLVYIDHVYCSIATTFIMFLYYTRARSLFPRPTCTK